MTGEPFWQREIGDLFSRSPKRKIKSGALSVFCRKLAFMLDAGVTTETALSVLLGEAKQPAAIRAAAARMHSGILRGLSLSHAMTETGVFPEFLCGMCRIGEMTARLPLIMSRLADYYEHQSRAEEELASALMYPAMVMLMMLGVMVLTVVLVLPGYARVFSATGVALPLATRVLLSVSSVLTEHAVPISLSVVLLIAASAVFLQSQPGKHTTAYIGLYTPLFRTVYRQTVGLRFVQALSLLLTAGRPLSEAIPVCADVTGNTLAQRDILRLTARLAEGMAFWESISEIAYLDPLLGSMARIGEETGRLPQTVDKCREYFEQTHAATIRRLNKLVEPAVTVVLGLLLGFIMLSVILPTFALTNIY